GAAFSATTEVIGTVCLNGAKPVVSYNEQFIISHQYVDPAEATRLMSKSSNILLVDLKTGEVARLTTMKSNQYAFAPHFRADGWLYFIFPAPNTARRDVWTYLSRPDPTTAPQDPLVPSDAALRRLNAEPPAPPTDTTTATNTP